MIYRKGKKPYIKLTDKEISDSADYFMEHYNGRYFISYRKIECNDQIFKDEDRCTIRKVMISRDDVVETLKKDDFTISDEQRMSEVYKIGINTFRNDLTDFSFGYEDFGDCLWSYYLPLVPKEYYTQKGLLIKDDQFGTKEHPTAGMEPVSDGKMEKIKEYLREFDKICKQRKECSKKIISFL